jgi:DNA-binding transcriptional MocR family regulator
VDSLELFRRALERRIAVMPGAMCASGRAYRHCIRISCGLPFSDEVDRALRTLAALVRRQRYLPNFLFTYS